MTRLLVIEGSVFGEQGNSSQLARYFVSRWQQSNPDGAVQYIDVVAEPFASFDAAAIAALSADPAERNIQQAQMIQHADELIAAVRNADALVLCAPMYNFNISSHLKSALDWLARAGVTFRYTEKGSEGLLPSIPVYVIATRGGCYHETGLDFQVPFVQQFLNFVGLSKIEVVLAEGLNISDEICASSMDRARERIDAFFED